MANGSDPPVPVCLDGICIDIYCLKPAKPASQTAQFGSPLRVAPAVGAHLARRHQIYVDMHICNKTKKMYMYLYIYRYIPLCRYIHMN